ncbi:hypothetical protein LJY25_05620 [Hymenobacter sp. BT175]|uniref:hypothetical protein n=1 Tax=Hymenobacter translucens TaxID=2886507 RepID=UPI001D0E41CB|nr:hypothetical protein [Hymenobacter translucens]MCC2545915.1 hypothetical protein [Hymenobacter translucens]
MNVRIRPADPSASRAARSRPAYLLRLLLVLVWAGLLTPVLTSCEEENLETQAPDRTPYTGEWSGQLMWGTLGPRDRVELTLRATAGSSAETMEGSILFVTDQVRRPVTVQWDRRAAKWNLTFNYPNASERNAVIGLSNNALRLDYQDGANQNYFANLNDARDEWVGTWNGNLACVSGAGRSYAWAIRKTTSRTGLEIANAGAPGTVISQGDLREGRMTGNAAISSTSYNYTLSYVSFTSRLNIGATAVGTSDACTGDLSR